MGEAWKKGLLVSLAGHGAILAVLLLGAVVAWLLRPEPPEFVFELAAEAPARALVPVEEPRDLPEPEPAEPPPAITAPRVPQAQELEALPPEVERVPVESPRSRTLSYEEFLRQNPHLAKAPQTVERAPARRPLPRLDIPVADLQESLEHFRREQPAASVSAADREAFERFFRDIWQRLDRAWERPGLAREDLSARVAFTVEADGRLTDVRFVASSGEVLFDQSIRAAFTRVGRVPSPPDGQSRRFTLTFTPR